MTHCKNQTREAFASCPQSLTDGKPARSSEPSSFCVRVSLISVLGTKPCGGVDCVRLAKLRST
jgi:hypothetical protein